MINTKSSFEGHWRKALKLNARQRLWRQPRAEYSVTSIIPLGWHCSLSTLLSSETYWFVLIKGRKFRFCIRRFIRNKTQTKEVTCLKLWPSVTLWFVKRSIFPDQILPFWASIWSIFPPWCQYLRLYYVILAKQVWYILKIMPFKISRILRISNNME